MESGRPCREVMLLNHPLIHAFSASSVEGNSHEGQGVPDPSIKCSCLSYDSRPCRWIYLRGCLKSRLQESDTPPLKRGARLRSPSFFLDVFSFWREHDVFAVLFLVPRWPFDHPRLAVHWIPNLSGMSVANCSSAPSGWRSNYRFSLKYINLSKWHSAKNRLAVHRIEDKKRDLGCPKSSACHWSDKAQNSPKKGTFESGGATGLAVHRLGHQM